MPRARDPNRDRAFQLWRDSEGTAKLKDIAEQLGVSEGTVRGWKNKDKWDALQETPVTPPKKPDILPKQSERSNQKERNAPNVTERSKQVLERNEPPPEEDNKDGSLTAKQRLFVMEYLRDFNATRAAMAVGYSKKTAYAIGWENLRKPQIQAEIQKQKDAMVDELGVSVQRIIAEYMKIAFADISEYVEFGQKEVPVMTMYGPMKDEEGNIVTKMVSYVSFKESEEVDGTIISEVKQGKDGVSIKLQDKMKALEALTKYLNILPEEQRLKIEKLKLDIEKMKGPNSENKNLVIQIDYGDCGQ